MRQVCCSKRPYATFPTSPSKGSRSLDFNRYNTTTLGRDALTQTHKGAMHREQSAGDGQRAHRRKRCVDSDVRQTAWTVPLQDRCGAAAICANANPSRVNASMRHGCTRPCTSFAATALQPTQLSASEADSELIAGAAVAQRSQPTGPWQPCCC